MSPGDAEGTKTVGEEVDGSWESGEEGEAAVALVSTYAVWLER